MRQAAVQLMGLTLAVAGACCSFAQDVPSRVSFSLPNPYATDYWVKQLERVIERLNPDRLRGAEAGTWEHRILVPGREALTANLHVDLSATPALYTLATSEGDVLVARWNVGSAADAVWLWEAPFYTAAILESKGSSLAPEALRSRCESLFRWDHNSAGLRSLNLTYFNERQGSERVVGVGDITQTEIGSYEFWVSALGREGTSYLSVWMSKSMLSYPPEADRVRERFPPLRERLRVVSRAALFDELGKGALTPALPHYPHNRDAIVIHELVAGQRLTPAEVRQVLIGNLDLQMSGLRHVVHGRMLSLLDAIEARKQAAVYAQVLRESLISLFDEIVASRLGIDASQLAISVLASMDRNHVDFTDAAVVFLERGVAVRYGLYYLARNVKDLPGLRRLEQTAIPPEFEHHKESCIRDVSVRLGLRPRTPSKVAAPGGVKPPPIPQVPRKIELR